MFDKPIHIFDLDGTVIDSRHRYKTLDNGDIDLAHWLEASKCVETVFRDSLLPRAQTMRRVYAEGHLTIVCTSRTLDTIWPNFLKIHNLPYHALLARPQGCMTGDADLKEKMLDEFFGQHNTCIDELQCVMYEDHLGVIDRLSRRGVLCSIEGYQ